MVPLDKLKQNAYKKLLPVFGDRESRAMIRALEDDLPDHPGYQPDGHGLVTWNEAIQRLLDNEPVAYITGKAYFLHLELKVNHLVLIPRPETETLVIEALRVLKSVSSPRVLDIGTGSGCIALAIRSAIHSGQVYGLDVDGSVLNIALENALKHRLDVQWIQSDILEPGGWKSLPYDLDMILSNPPYILDSEKKFMSTSALKYEPPLALFAGEDPLCFYKAIASFGLENLKTGGVIMVEINEFMVEETLAVFQIPGYSQSQLIRDLSGKDRIISVVRA